LDETLIKATNDASKFPDGLFDERCVLDIQELQKKDIYLSYRPYLFEMLSQLKKNFELILFTAGFDKYATTIVKLLHKDQKYFDYVISRESCTPHPNGKFQVKDLIQLLEGRNIKDIIIVDNRATSFAIHFTNGIPIKDYEGDKSDKWLMSLCAYLMQFQGLNDVRTKIKQDFKLDKYVTERGNLRNKLKYSS